MLGLRRRPLCIAKKSWRVLNSRSVQQLVRLVPKALPPKRIPVVTPKASRLLSPNAKRSRLDPEEALPPLVILQSASKSGAMEISPEKALDILRRYQALEIRASRGWEEQLCRELDINSSTLVLLSRILNRCPGKAQRHLARRVMLTASELGDDEATIILVVAGIRSSNFRDYEKPLKKLGVMAKEGNPRAMTLSGRIAASQGRNKEALGWFRKATQGPTGLDFEEAGEALVCEGQLLMKDDTKAAQAVLRKAALELDDPSAYFYLAELEEKGSQSQAVYLMKAASSGIIEAAHELGSIELSKTTKASEGNSPPSYGIAREWFQLAAVGDYGPSMLQLAQICKESGEPDEGLKWLEKAKKREDVREQALQMRDSWEL